MAVQKSLAKKRYYTVAEANAALPLVRVIVRDISELAQELKDRHERIERLQSTERGRPSEAHQEELDQVTAEFERGQERMAEFERELKELGVELKDCLTGLIDFRAQLDGREVYLCWRLGEPEVAWWHELHAGFLGRQQLIDVTRRTAGAGPRTSAGG